MKEKNIKNNSDFNVLSRNIVDNKESKEIFSGKNFYKKWQLWAIMNIFLCLGLVFCLFLLFNKKESEPNVRAEKQESELNVEAEKQEEKEEKVLLEEIDVNGLSIKEACDRVRSVGWRVNKVLNAKGFVVTSCADEERIVDHAFYVQEETYGMSAGTVNLYHQGNETPNTSSPSSSSPNSTIDDGKCSEYEKNLEIAKTAYDLAKKNYDTFKAMGISSSELDQYQSALDASKNSLDAAQKIYDITCR